MKKIFLSLLLVMCLLIMGCFFYKSVKKYKNYTDSEVIDIAYSYIEEEAHYSYDSVYELKIIDIKPLEVCTFAWNVCHTYKTVEGAHEYIVEARNKNTGIAEFQINVKDRYYLNGELIIPRATSSNVENQKYYLRYKNLINLLNRYSSIKYYLIDDSIDSSSVKIIQYGYIYSSNIEELESFLKAISKKEYEYYWYFIVTNDIDEYNSLVNSSYNFGQLLGNYEESTVTYKVDLSSFENNPHGVISNTSQGSITCVNTVLIKRNN